MNNCLWLALTLVAAFLGIPILAYVTTKMIRYGWLRADQSFKSQQQSEEKTDGNAT
jgi:hypothetical protein